MGRCTRPFINKEGVPLPCGRHCDECLKRRVSGWSFRLLKEAEKSISAFFITLTYHSPPITKGGYMNLKKSDVTKFIRKIRKQHNDKKGIKYFAVGEYGSRTKRPHYHIIMFNVELDKILSKSEAHDIKTNKIVLDGKAMLNLAAWSDEGQSKGYATIGALSPASVAYTLKYVSKKSRIPMHKNDDRQPEFAHMSKGLGLNYLTPANYKMHQRDPMRQYLTLYDGKKIALPRYYKERLYDSLERQEISKIIAAQELQKHLEKSPEQIAHEARVKRNKIEKGISSQFTDNEKI